MKNITNSSSSLLVVIAGLVFAAAPALFIGLVLQSAAGAFSAFVTSMLVLTVCNDYAPKSPPLQAGSRSRQLSQYPLAA